MRSATRLAPPRMPSGRIVLQPPPELVAGDGAGGVLTSLLPMIGSVGSIVMVSLSGAGPTGYLAGGMFLLSSLGFVAVNGWRQRSQRAAQTLASRREYLAYLGELRATVRTAGRQQRRHGNWVSPAPAALAFIAEERTRVGERDPSDDSFLLARVGVSDQPLCLTLEAPELPPLAQLDPVSASAAHRFMLTHEVQPALPTAIRLADYARVEVTGDDEESVRSLARAMIAGIATLHDPDSVRIAVLADETRLAEWEWAKWLPHTHSARERDRLGPARLISSSLDELEALLPASLAERSRFGRGSAPHPHVIVVVDGVRRPAGHPLVGDDGMVGVTVVDLPERWGELEDGDTLRIALPSRPGAEAELIDLSQPAVPFLPDAMSIAEAEATARRLLALMAGPSESIEVGGPVSTSQRELVDLLSLPDVREIDFDAAWRGRLERDRLRVPIGQETNGAPMILDLKEAAQQGMGPHGVLIGATGSGKSEVLRTLVLALALTHSPEQLNFVLVDFKGGATFAGMAGMPHVSAIITNLGSELALVDRFQDALQGEVVRRQELLRASGNFANVSDYEKARRGGRTDLEPLPALLIVADEFSELLAAKPEFVDSFINIGRVGRSLQVHLLLASQRLEEGKLRGLDTYLSYRVGLRTFSAAESRTVLGVPDAYTLPQEPGVGYLKVGTDPLVQFRAAYVSGPPRGGVRAVGASGGGGGSVDDVELFTARALPMFETEPPDVVEEEIPDAAPRPGDDSSTFQIAVDRMAGQGPAAHQVWLPPLDEPPSLDQLMPDLAVDPELGLVSAEWRARGALTVPLGIVDVPLEQRRERLVASLAGAAGHVAIVGGPLSGKTTMARTLVAALALTTTPRELQVYALDFGGGGFTGLQGLPHMAGVATRTEAEAVRRIVGEIESILDARELYFRQHGVDSIDTYRTRRARGLVDDGYGDVFLVIDGWPTLREQYELLEPRIQTLAARGLSFGVHIVVTANRWMEIRSSLKDLIQTRLELRLGDPADSEVDRKQASNVPRGAPGRGVAASKLQMLSAVPRVDGLATASELADGVEDLVARTTAAWQGPAGPKLRLLPKRITLDELRALAPADDPRMLLGVDEAALAPFGVDPAVEPHLYLYGDAGSGKSSFLRGLVREIIRHHPDGGAKIFVVDYRRSLLGDIPAEYLGAYLTNHELATGGLAQLAQFFAGRIPGPDVTPEQLRSRSWWTGAEGYILVDDYDLVATSQGNPVAVLQPLLAQAQDLGLHVAITRRTGGASRASYDPIIQRFTDLGVTGILLAGNPEEGALIGRVKPMPAVPGRAQVVSRDRGLVVAQLAFSPSANA